MLSAALGRILLEGGRGSDVGLSVATPRALPTPRPTTAAPTPSPGAAAGATGDTHAPGGDDSTAEAKRARLAAAAPLDLFPGPPTPRGGRPALGPAVVAALERVVRIYGSDELTEQPEASSGSRGFAGQVSVGGRVYFLLLRPPSGAIGGGDGGGAEGEQEQVCVAKFCKSATEVIHAPRSCYSARGQFVIAGRLQ